MRVVGFRSHMDFFRKPHSQRYKNVFQRNVLQAATLCESTAAKTKEDIRKEWDARRWHRRISVYVCCLVFPIPDNFMMLSSAIIAGGERATRRESRDSMGSPTGKNNLFF